MKMNPEKKFKENLEVILIVFEKITVPGLNCIVSLSISDLVDFVKLKNCWAFEIRIKMFS